MGSAELRWLRAEEERQRRASEVTEIMVPGHGMWTAAGLKVVLDERERFFGFRPLREKTESSDA